jgi:hypothetical protein
MEDDPTSPAGRRGDGFSLAGPPDLWVQRGGITIRESIRTPVLPQERAMRALLPSALVGCLLGCAPLSAAGPPPRGDSFRQSQWEVRFTGAKGVQLAGTLLLPARKAADKVPGVVLVAGSGPTDRDGNSVLLRVKIDLLKQIAELLAGEGIASLRYDKRGQYASEKAPRDRKSLEAFVLWENYVGDAAAALGYLQGQKEIDAGRTAMLGHSEGGMLVLQAAGEGKGFHKPPAALVLASTPGRRCDVILRE